MENVLPKYERPLKSIEEPTVKVEHWEQAYNAFEEKKYRKAIFETLNYINPRLLKRIDLEKPVNLTQMHGSAEVHISITDKNFSLKAPFLKMTSETNQVALLRKVSEVNFDPLTLVQIRLEKNELWFEYETDISLCQPYKIYDILREVCMYADDYDDMFIERYQASFYKEPEKKLLTSEEYQKVWGQISAVLQDYNNYSQFFKEKRWDDYLWDLIVISLLKIANMPYVHGTLRSDLDEYIPNLFNGNLDFKYRIDKGTNFINNLCKKSEDEIMKDVYHAEKLISLQYRSSKEIIKEQLENSRKFVDEYEAKQSYFNLSYYLQFTFLKLLYDFNLENDYKTVIQQVLEEVSGLTPGNAAPKLFKAFYDLYTGNINKKSANKGTKKGLFSRLFS